MSLQEEIKRRRTFAIISHPDAGKTTITEKLLLYGGAVQMAGVVKAKKSKKFATSDWMELEKQRGISVTSSVMNFHYGDCEINLIDTPGHQDFSEDTYRTLTAVDSALMLIDVANGVETQTKKLFAICKAQKTPVIAFINKMDREGKACFDLLDEVEKVLGTHCAPMTWPIGMGDRFYGVYHRYEKKVHLFDRSGDHSRKQNLIELDDPQKIRDLPGYDPEVIDQFLEEIALLDGASEHFDREAYLRGEQVPVFFGSALTNFGVEILLNALLQYAPPPQPRQTIERVVFPEENKLSAYVFKIQANMDPAHRDRVAFLRICSGVFERGMKAFHVRLKKEIRLARPTQFMAQDRSLIDQAYAGDVIGVHDPGLFEIGDAITEGESLYFTGIPSFSPEHFVRVILKDPLKSKQLHKALNQLSEEGAVQVFRPVNNQDQLLGVIGLLQFDVVQYRIQHEYNVQIAIERQNLACARWLSGPLEEVGKFIRANRAQIALDRENHYVLLLSDEWRLKLLVEKFPQVLFLETTRFDQKMISQEDLVV